MLQTGQQLWTDRSIDLPCNVQYVSCSRVKQLGGAGGRGVTPRLDSAFNSTTASITKAIC